MTSTIDNLGKINDIQLQINSVYGDKYLPTNEKIKRLYLLLELLFEIATNGKQIHFTTFFSRIAFLSKQFKWPANALSCVHILRKINETHQLDKKDEAVYLDKLYEILGRIQQLLEGEEVISPIEIPNTLRDYIANYDYQKSGFVNFIDGLAIDIDRKTKTIRYLVNSVDEDEKLVRYDVAGKNDLFTNVIQAIEGIVPFPFALNLVDVDIADDGSMIPNAFVLFPDYLLDVTTIASTHGEDSANSWLYLLTKFREKINSPAIMIGNTANIFLDLLIKNPDLEFEELKQAIFNLDPLSWSVFDDDTVKNALIDLQMHFTNIKKAIKNDFSAVGLDNGKMYLEPTFYCREYGIQGRLDLFHINDKRTKADIIELKSGKIFKPNAYGINQAHYAQTLLYELLIKSAFKNKLQSTNYILYSTLAESSLKLAPSGRSMYQELIKVRNEIVLIEHALAHQKGIIRKVFNYLKVDNFLKLKGFNKEHLSQFESIYLTLDDTEKRYFEHFTGFIAREHLLAKTGEHSISKSNGLSALWLETTDEKADRFAILNHLKIVKNDSNEQLPTIKLVRTKFSAELSNFRIGDIAVLYPHQHNSKEVLHHEIFKCSILEMTDDHILIRMRHPQLNHHLFKTTSFWNLEEDVLDSSFRHMYRNLFEFVSAPKETRQLLLGRAEPRYTAQDTSIEIEGNATNEQKAIIRKIYQTKDYLLLWGPPGTGKTSIIIRNAAKILYNNSKEVVLYLAYTNKAVDEICTALYEAGLGDEFIRIGSQHSINEAYKVNLLDVVIGKCTTRSSIINKLKGTRIYVATVVSLSGKPELFELLQIDTAIVDEASQILEPSIIGILARFKRFVLIGDHKQLPAVVVQNESYTRLTDIELNDVGISDMRMSLFERLMHQVQHHGWHHCVDILQYQGRMHKDIMNFVSHEFYEGNLKVLSTIKRLGQSLSFKHGNSLQEALASNRMSYIDTEVGRGSNWKINETEADIVIGLINEYVAIYNLNEWDLTPDSIGVITPYRAQIALIKSKLASTLPITVDTVERYQGGARDIIIFSTCTNRASQLERLVSLSVEGIDRKLNVAITRSKEQFILIGNKEILSSNPIYEKLINRCSVIEVNT